jgi:outer membrane protein OmpA-like peptidoglycan-associated protein
MKKLNFAGLLLCLAAVSILAGCATPILKSSSRAKHHFYYSGVDTSWYGKSGARPAPVKDANTLVPSTNPVKKGSWWMPKRAPQGKENTIWGNRGYVYLAGNGPNAPKKLPVEKTALQVVYFPFDSVELTLSARTTLNANVKVLKEYPQAKMVLMGYASPEGSDDYNLKLSKNRALAVKSYLMKNGIPDGSISVKGEGKIEVKVSDYPSARKVYFKLTSQ